MLKLRKIYTLLERLVGRRFLWRLGRFLYLGARRELSNDPRTDGEFELQRLVAERCRAIERPVIWDVGANLGVWSAAMMQAVRRCNKTTKIVAFEPAPDQYQTLRSIVVPDNIGFEVRELALGSNQGAVDFEVTGSATGSSSIVTHGELNEANSRVVSVRMSTIDKEISGFPYNHITFLKVDTEGNDFNVLLGAVGMLKAHRIELIQFEYGPHWIRFSHSLRDVMDYAKSLDYRFGKLTKYEIEIYDEWHPELDRFILSNFVMFVPYLENNLRCRRVFFDNYNILSSDCMSRI